MARPPRPTADADSRFFWEGVEKGELRIQRCAACGTLRHPPRPMCASCHALEWESAVASGRGEIYSYVTFHHPPIPPFEYPNVIVLVELEEGTRVVSNLPGVKPEDVKVGQPVQAFYADLEKDRTFLQFKLAD